MTAGGTGGRRPLGRGEPQRGERRNQMAIEFQKRVEQEPAEIAEDERREQFDIDC